jgi:hypothetical protein
MPKSGQTENRKQRESRETANREQTDGKQRVDRPRSRMGHAASTKCSKAVMRLSLGAKNGDLHAINLSFIIDWLIVCSVFAYNTLRLLSALTQR